MKAFKEGLNTAVFTTTFVIKGNKPITYVSHDFEDGAWQFFSEDKFENFEDVAMVVGLGQMIERDKSLLNIADLPLGYTATRDSLTDTWTISKSQKE
jgi:hypothetical protein